MILVAETDIKGRSLHKDTGMHCWWIDRNQVVMKKAGVERFIRFKPSKAALRRLHAFSIYHGQGTYQLKAAVDISNSPRKCRVSFEGDVKYVFLYRGQVWSFRRAGFHVEVDCD